MPRLGFLLIAAVSRHRSSYAEPSDPKPASLANPPLVGVIGAAAGCGPVLAFPMYEEESFRRGPC